MTGRIGVARGTALYVGAVLGPGVLVLPALAVQAAGPASLLAWTAMLALSVPIAAAFAALGIRHPDSGGVATFTRRAFGPTPAAVAAAASTWWRYHPAQRDLPAGRPVPKPAGGTRPRRIAEVDVQPRRSYDLVNPAARTAATSRTHRNRQR
ncbi:amino acid permease [Micromonospora sp. M71_S20]|uniref:amino acid permease n=1 Tax=Micromonospora sp. M71_S20 TaxID=592872 RepID=UPI001F476E4C|nr:amino acid permease [Micromonospora sp. M71_S20]